MGCCWKTRQLAIFRQGAVEGLGPEVADEEIVRAMMVVRANTMTYEAASPQLTQRLLDLLNDGITPAVQSRGIVGEGDWRPWPTSAPPYWVAKDSLAWWIAETDVNDDAPIC